MMRDAPIYDALVIEREGHPTDDDIAAARTPGPPHGYQTTGRD